MPNEHPRSKLLNNALMVTDSIKDILVDQNKIKMLVNQSRHFTHELEDVPDISDQKKSGRCWMFANLYYYRSAMIKKYKLDSKFDFSTSWLFFYDKLEKFRHALYLLRDDPELRSANSSTSLEYSSYIYLGDGGHTDSLLNLVEKYGVVPKDAYGESNNTEKTRELNKLIERLFKVYAFRMKSAEADHELEELVQEGIKECRRLLEYCLGVPPETFVWQYRGKDDNAKSREVKHSSAPFTRRYYETESYTPTEFWKKVKESAKHQLTTVASTNDPFHDRVVHIAGIKQCCNIHENMGARTYLTLGTDTILEYAKSLIRDGLPVVFACGVDRESYHDKKFGVMDRSLFRYEEFCPSLKGFDGLKDQVASQLEGTNHVMCIVGYNVLNNTWKIANSWGTDRGYSGFWIATTEWFKARLCKFNIPLTILSDEHREIAEGPTTKQYKFGDSHC